MAHQRRGCRHRGAAAGAARRNGGIPARLVDPARGLDGGGLAFGLAYAVVVLVHIGLFTRTQRVRSASDLVRVGLINVAGTVLILVGGALGGVTQLVLWILVPLVWWLVSPYRAFSGGFEIGAAHFVERHGLGIDHRHRRVAGRAGPRSQ